MSPPRLAAAPSAAGAQLTPRQREVLHLLSFRLTNAEIAAMLSLSQRTVECHVSSILAALHVANRRDAASFAMQGQQRFPLPTPPRHPGFISDSGNGVPRIRGQNA